MIAYNHYIKFIPELKNSKKKEDTYSNIITIQENTTFNLDDKLLYELIFYNNQNRDLSLYTDKEFARTQQDQFWAFEVKGVMTFFWYSGTLSLEYKKHDNFTEELLEYWSLHIILPAFFTIEETFYFLHAGAVEVEGKSILFIAESFGGKSTITDFFMKQGHVVISDDKVGTYEKYGKFYAVPSHPHHRPYRKIEDLGFYIENFAKYPKTIHAVYELVKSDANANIIIDELKGVEKFISSQLASEMKLSFQKPTSMVYLAKMVKNILIFKVMIPWDIERLDEVYDTICNHSRNIKIRKNS